MRRLVVLLCLALCASCDKSDGADEPAASSVRISGVTPHQITTNGGEITIGGAGFAEPVTVEIGGEKAEVIEVRPDAVRVQAPALPVGTADVRVKVSGEPAIVLPGALTVTRPGLRFAVATEDTVEAPEAGEVRDAAAFDTDGDGDADLVLATDDGLRVLVNDGAGRLSLLRTHDAVTGEDVPARPGGRGDVRALAVGDLDGDRIPELIACTGAGRDLRFHGSLTGLADAGALPWRAGGCRAVAFVDVERGKRGLAFAVEDAPGHVGLLLLTDQGEGRLDFARSLAPPPDAPAPVGTADSADPASPPTLEQALDDAQEGHASARLTYALTDVGPDAVLHFTTSLPDVPDRVALWARNEGGAVTVRVRLTDAAGAVFEGAEQALNGAGWTQLAWTAPWSPEGAPMPPIAVSLVVHAAGAPPVQGQLRVDTVTAEKTGAMPWLVDDFERRAPLHAWPAVARLLSGDLDGDGLGDVIVLGGDKPALLRTRPADQGMGPAFAESAAPVTGPGPYVAGATLDADGDGDLDAVLVSGAQDRLLVGDGYGRLLDATFGSLPVDWADGTSLAQADVDGDGVPDLVVGNRAHTDRLYLGRGDGRFLDATPDFGFDAVDTAAVVVADLDGDGDADVVSVPAAGDAAPHVRIRLGDEP